MSGEPVLEVEGIVKTFGLRRSLLERVTGAAVAPHRAVDGVSFVLRRGEILGLAGGSGSGKTTLARCVLRLTEPDDGSVRLGGDDVLAASGGPLRELRRRMQMVFQDPYTSLNPRLSVGDAILEAARVHGRPGAEDGDAFIRAALERVRLSPTFAERMPRELSGGQSQRVAIARALATDPEVIIADEAVSALDVSVQAQLLKLLVQLRDELGVSILFVAHQLAVLAETADRVAIMHEGRIVETGETAAVFGAPQDPYTRALLDAHPRADPRRRPARVPA